MALNAWVLLMLTLGPAATAQDRPGPPTPVDEKGIVTVRDALDALNRAPAPTDPGRPVPIGNAGQWFGPDAYPAAAIRAGAQGRVVAQVAVDGDGRVAGCAVSTSSGSPDLDAATCAIANRRMSFTPAHDVSGRAMAGEYRLAVNWRLPAGSPSVGPAATMLVSVGDDGSVLSCASVMPTPLGDLCGAFPTGRKLDVPASMRGKVFMIGTVVRPLAE